MRERSALAAAGARRRGFTLVEMLVVMVIIGIIASVATLSIGVLGRDRELEQEARRLWAVIKQTKEETELQGREVGVFVERDGYFFMRYDKRAQTWKEVQEDDLMAQHDLPDGVSYRLWLDGREAILKAHQENLAAFDIQRASQSASDQDKEKDPRVPQIALLSSGDTTPFELRIERFGGDAGWRVTSLPDNTLSVEAADE